MSFNRNLTKLPGALTPGVVPIFLKFLVGATGAVESIVEGGDGEGIASVVRTSEGLYTITLEDEPLAILHVEPGYLAAAGVDAVPQAGAADAEAKTVQIRFLEYDGDGAVSVVDPTEDDYVTAIIWVKTRSHARL